MANLITHLYFGKKVYEKLPKSLKTDCIDKHMDAFLFGTIGPDFMFALREIGDKCGRYCNVMQYCHTLEVFESIAKHIGKNNDKCQLAYALGLICHYALDYNIHPYVNFMVEEGLSKQIPGGQQLGIHTLVESAVDEYLVTEMMGFKNSNDYRPSENDLKTSKKTKNAIAGLYFDAINDIIKIYPSKFKIKLAMRLTVLTLWLADDKSGRKAEKYSKKEENSDDGKKTVRNLIRPPEFYGEADYLNFNRIPYRKVRNEDKTENKTAIELLDDCIDIGVDLIDKFLLAAEGKKSLYACDFCINYEGVNTYLINKKNQNY